MRGSLAGRQERIPRVGTTKVNIMMNIQSYATNYTALKKLFSYYSLRKGDIIHPLKKIYYNSGSRVSFKELRDIL